MLSYTARFEAYYGDGDSWGTFEFYEDFSDLLLEAISSGEPFDTGWKGIKKEIASFRIARHASGKFLVMVSCSDDFDTEGYGYETFGVSECGSAEEVLDLIRERLTEAYSGAERDREDNEQYYGFSIHPMFGEHSGAWMHTLILPRNTEAECPPGDNYGEWGFEESTTEPMTEEEKKRSPTWLGRSRTAITPATCRPSRRLAGLGRSRRGGKKAMTKEEALKELRRYIKQNYGTQTAYAAELKVSNNLVSEVLLGKRGIPRYMLNEIGLKAVKTVTYEPIQPGD